VPSVMWALHATPLQRQPTQIHRPDFQKYLCGSRIVYFLDYVDRLDVIRALHQSRDAQRHL
jgi:plasmid stabilization system protein ParE